MLRVELYFDGHLVGRSHLESHDPPMGVSGGPFEPATAYNRAAHAGYVEGAENPSVDGSLFVVRSPEHGFVDCQGGVLIQDCFDSLGEREVVVAGIPYPEYEAWFGNDPWFNEYYGKE